MPKDQRRHPTANFTRQHDREAFGSVRTVRASLNPKENGHGADGGESVVVVVEGDREECRRKLDGGAGQREGSQATLQARKIATPKPVRWIRGCVSSTYRRVGSGGRGHSRVVLPWALARAGWLLHLLAGRRRTLKNRLFAGAGAGLDFVPQHPLAALEGTSAQQGKRSSWVRRRRFGIARASCEPTTTTKRGRLNASSLPPSLLLVITHTFGIGLLALFAGCS